MTRLALVGDVHGDVTRLRRLFDALDKQADRTVVFLGDYVNLGPDPAGVLDLLCMRKDRFGDRLILLEGNHDRTFREFLHGGDLAPILAMGGATTVRSYIGQPTGEVSRRLRASVPRLHIDLLDSLQESWSNDRVLALHKWPDEHLDRDGLFVVLGHYHQRRLVPDIGDNVAYIDTGCGSDPNGVLTCLLLPEREWSSY